MNIQTSTSTTRMVAVRKQRRTGLHVSTWIVEIVKYLLLILLSASFLLPFYWMISSALKNDAQVYTVPPIWFPIPARWINFWEAWNIDNFNLYVFNTVIRYAIPSTIGTLVSCTLVAYGFGRIRWPGRS